jgi:hypothetical protein
MERERLMVLENMLKLMEYHPTSGRNRKINNLSERISLIKNWNSSLDKTGGEMAGK